MSDFTNLPKSVAIVKPHDPKPDNLAMAALFRVAQLAARSGMSHANAAAYLIVHCPAMQMETMEQTRLGVPLE